MFSQLLSAASLTLFFFASGYQEQQSERMAIENVNVVNVIAGTTVSSQTIVVQDKKISFVGSAKQLPADWEITTRIDGTGKYAIPGLWDMHIHAMNVNDMKLFPINGVVGVRLMWGMPIHHSWRKQFETGEKLGPRMMIASGIIDGPKPIWPGSIVASDKESGIKAVQAAVDSHSDFAKVYSLLPRDAYFAIAKQCKSLDLPFDGHVPRMVSAIEASNAGHRCVEHMYEMLLACSSKEDELRKTLAEFVGQHDGQVRSLYDSGAPTIMRRAVDTFDAAKADKLFETFKKNNTWQCPTLTVLRNMAYLTEPEVQNDPNLKYISKGLRNFIAPKKRRRNKSEQDIKFERERYQKKLGLLKRMHEVGVPVLAGTDVLNPFCLPGFSLHTELELMVNAGLSPAEALRTATINPAKFQQLENEMGSIAANKIADFVLLQGNPLADITNTKNIELVVVRGQLLTRDKLNELLKSFEN